MLELVYVLIVVVVTPFVYLTKLYTKKGEFTVCKFYLNKSERGDLKKYLKNQGVEEYFWGRIKFFSLFSLSPHTHTHTSPVFSETSHPWYMFHSHLRYFRKVIYIQKTTLHLFFWPSLFQEGWLFSHPDSPRTM